jgi:glutamine synthetase
MVRVPAPGRFEIRVLDGAANPYLAFSAILAAGLDGIGNKTDPGVVNHGNLYEVPEEELAARKIGLLPTTLAEALDSLEQDSVVKGSLGLDYAKEYIRVKREEWRQYNQTVSEWERERYLPTY